MLYPWINRIIVKMSKTGFSNVTYAEWGVGFPEDLDPDTIYILHDETGSTVYAVNFLCPCGCGMETYTPVHPDNIRHWNFSFEDGKVTISPSILFTGGCKSHFFIEGNQVRWC